MSDEKDPKFKFWISGYLTEELTVSEMFLVARNRLSLSLMLAIGLVSGSVTSVGYNLPVMVLPPFLLVNAIAPPLLILIAAGLVAVFVQMHYRFWGQRTGKILTIPTVIPTTIAFVPAYLLIEYIRVLLIGKELDLTWYVFIVPYLPFVAISEILIAGVFKMLTPEILPSTSENTHIETSEHVPDQDAQLPVQLEIEPNVEECPATDQFEPVFIDVGDHRIAASDVVLMKAEGNYVRLVTPHNSFLERASLREMSDKLGQLGMQVHRSIWISYAYVVDHYQAAGQLKVTMLGDHEVNVAVRRIKEVEGAIARFRKGMN